MIDDINTKRTELANQMAAAGTPENIAAILPATISPARRMRHGDRPTEALVFDEPAATSGDAPADLQQLKALALAATPGPWHVTKYCSVMDQDMDTLVASSDSSNEDRAFIAAANPVVVLDLVARIERLKTSFELARANYEQVVEKNAELNARIERSTAHVQPVNTFSERVENAAGNEQVERAASGATASGDELPESLVLDMARAACLDTSRISTVIDFAGSVARAAVSASTKPTAQAFLAAELPAAEPVYRVSDIATKPAAAPVAWLATDLDGRGDVAFTKEEAKRRAGEGCIHFYPLFDVEVPDATPAASTIEAAQTADQVRDQALEDAARHCESAELLFDVDELMQRTKKELTAITANMLAEGVRALKRPATTHNLEAGATQTTEGAGK